MGWGGGYWEMYKHGESTPDIGAASLNFNPGIAAVCLAEIKVISLEYKQLKCINE